MGLDFRGRSPRLHPTMPDRSNRYRRQKLQRALVDNLAGNHGPRRRRTAARPASCTTGNAARAAPAWSCPVHRPAIGRKGPPWGCRDRAPSGRQSRTQPATERCPAMRQRRATSRPLGSVLARAQCGAGCRAANVSFGQPTSGLCAGRFTAPRPEHAGPDHLALRPARHKHAANPSAAAVCRVVPVPDEALRR